MVPTQKPNVKLNQRRGILYAVIGAMLWGLSGSVAQYLFASAHLAPTWLVGVRLFCAGGLLLGWYAQATHASPIRIWQWRNGWRLLAFAWLGMLPSQATYFMAINYGNAATATVLQFLGPLFIVVYMALANRRWPRRIDLLAIGLAMLGTSLLVTQGRLTSLAISIPAVVWGLLAGVSQASYTLLPRRLLREFDARLVVGWAMLLGSMFFWPQLLTVQPPALSAADWWGIGFIIVGGTMLAYLFYLKSLAYISPSATGMLSAFEPLTATVVAVVCLGTRLALAELIGGGLILVTTGLQAWPQKPMGKR